MPDPWSDRISTHPLRQSAEKVQAAISQALKDTTISESAASTLHRIQAVLDYLRLRIDGTDPRLIPLVAFDNAVSILDQITPEIEQFTSNRNEGHLANADNRVDSVIVQLGAGLPPLPFSKERQLAERATKTYIQRLQEQESGYRERVKRLVAELAAHDQKISAAEGRINNAVATAEQNIETVRQSVESRLTDLQNVIEGQKGRLDSAIEQQSATFLDSQQKQLQQFSDNQSQREDAFKERTQKIIEEAQSEISGLAEEAQGSIEYLHEQEERAREVLAVTASEAVAGRYVLVAEDQRKQADVWRWASIVSAVVLLIVGIVVTFQSPVDEPDRSTSDIILYFAVRTPLALVIAAAFGYTASQSRHHRDREHVAEQRALELAAFRPFIANLPEADQQAETRAATKRYFPGATGNNEALSEDRTPLA
jgi:hypothetical protein